MGSDLRERQGWEIFFMGESWTICCLREVSRDIGIGPWSWKCEFATPASLIIWLKSRKITWMSYFALKMSKNKITLMKINKFQVYSTLFWCNNYWHLCISNSLSPLPFIWYLNCAAGTRPHRAHSLTVIGPRSKHVTQGTLEFFTFSQKERALFSVVCMEEAHLRKLNQHKVYVTRWHLSPWFH